MASGCAAMGEPGPGCGVWDLAAVPQPAEPGGARAVLWLTGRAGGGSSASDDGPLSDLGVSGCVFTGKVKSLLEIQPAGKLPLGRGSAPGEHACRRRAAIATIRMTSLRAPAPPGSWPPALCLTGHACVCSRGLGLCLPFLECLCLVCLSQRECGARPPVRLWGELGWVDTAQRCLNVWSCFPGKPPAALAVALGEGFKP